MCYYNKVQQQISSVSSPESRSLWWATVCLWPVWPQLYIKGNPAGASHHPQWWDTIQVHSVQEKVWAT